MKSIHALFIVALGLTLAACAPPSGPNNTVPNNNPGPSNHDGSYASPVQLTVGSVISGKIGADGTADQTSYYRFNAGSGADLELILTDDSAPHTINGIWQQLSVQLEDQSGNDDRTGYILAEGLRPVFEELAAGHDYILFLGNNLDTAGTYQLRLAAYTDPNEGSVETPEPLELSSAHSGTASNIGGSYFTFNSGDNTSLTFDYDVEGLSLMLYTSSDFGAAMTGFVGNNLSASDGLWTVTVTADTPYYLQVRPGVNMGALYTHSVDYTLTVAPTVN